MRQKLVQVAEQEVDVETALVRLVDDQGVVAQQPTVPLDLGEQDAVGHDLHQGAVGDLVGEPHRVADGLAEGYGQLVGDALRDGTGRKPAGLGVPDHAPHAAAGLQADLGQLGGLARSGLPRHDDHLVLADGGREVIAAGTDRKVRVGDGRHRRGTGGDECLTGGYLAGEIGKCVGAERSAR